MQIIICELSIFVSPKGRGCRQAHAVGVKRGKTLATSHPWLAFDWLLLDISQPITKLDNVKPQYLRNYCRYSIQNHSGQMYAGIIFILYREVPCCVILIKSVCKKPLSPRLGFINNFEYVSRRKR